MNALSSPIPALFEHLAPALTWYSFSPVNQDNSETADASLKAASMLRQELGGPVMARWLSKAANLLGSDLADLFGSDAPRSIEIALPGTWQEHVWAAAGALMGWEVRAPRAGQWAVDEDAPPPAKELTPEADLADVYVTNATSPRAQAHVRAGCDVLFHNTAPLALSWSGALPDGAMDALEALMSQPDGLIVDLADSPSPLEPPSAPFALAAGLLPSPSHEAPERLLLPYPTHGLTHALVTLWSAGRSAVLVPHEVGAAEQLRIAQVERATTAQLSGE